MASDAAKAAAEAADERESLGQESSTVKRVSVLEDPSAMYDEPAAAAKAWTEIEETTARQVRICQENPRGHSFVPGIRREDLCYLCGKSESEHKPKGERP